MAPPKNKKGPVKKDEPQYTANQLFTAFMVAIAAFLVFALWPDMSETRHYDAMLAKMGVKRGRVQTVCSGSGVDRQCWMESKKPVQRGDTMVTIPQDAVVQYTTIRAESQFENIVAPDSESLTALFEENKLDRNFHLGGFAMAFKIWHEMKLGSSSLYAPWFDLMPKQYQSAIFLSDEEALCLDKLSQDDRNRTVGLADSYTAVIEGICKTDDGAALNSCYYLTKDTLREEVRKAVGIVMSRTWGEFSNPMFIPMLDFTYPHPDLCNPEGDGDVKCAGRDKQYILSPQDDPAQNAILFKTIMGLDKGERLYSVVQNRAPWETMSVHGYVDYAAQAMPDLEFVSRVNAFAQQHQVHPDSLAADHPMKNCFSRQNAQWTVTGSPKKELRQCWAAMFYFTENPQHMAYDEIAREAYAAWKEDKVEQAKSKYLAWRHTLMSARNIGAHVLMPKADYCGEQRGRLPQIRKVYEEASLDFFNRITTVGTKHTEQAFAKWEALDASADRNIPEPSAPTAEDLDIEEDEAEEVQETEE